MMGQQAGSQGVRTSAIGLAAALSLLALATLLAIAGLGADSTRAQGTPPASSSAVTVPQSVERSCFERQLTDAAGVESIAVAGPDLTGAAYGLVQARLEGPAGSDWDLTVFDASGTVVAASASSGPSEVAAGYLANGDELTIQACRISGDGDTAEVSVSTETVDASEVEKASLARVQIESAVDEQTLDGLGLDLSEDSGEGYIGVVLHGAEDREALDRVGLDYNVITPDLGRESDRLREADAQYAAKTQRSPLPSGRDTYRRLFEYSQELKDLAEKNAEIVRPITLNHETYEGRPVEGIEITTDPNNLRDGKPVFMQIALHHAREWPSGEHAMEFAYDLIKGYKSGDARIRDLLERTRTIVIPVVNPDGFNASREAGELQGSGNGEDGSFLTTFPTSPNEYRRKNCRFPMGDGGSCLQPAFGIASGGVDPNRNYGAFWGGPGASGDVTAEDYFGPGPFSEPETQNIRELVSARQVTTLITNHTFSNLVLRPPGLASEPVPVDEPVFKALGDAMAAENGYISQAGFELYDTTGTTEDWSYNATGGLGFTFEIYCNNTPDPLDDRCSGNFHPTFPNVVAEYEGTSPDAQAIGGGGNREAYLIALENTADASKHSLLQGEAPPGAIIRLEKTFQTPTSVEDPASFEDHLETELKVPSSGKFDYHINPSTRPLVAQARGRQSQGPPSGSVGFAGAPDPVTNRPCGSAETNDPACFADHPFEIQNGAGVDNDSATVQVDWATPASDYDLFVYTDSDGDGTSLVADGPDDGTEPDTEPNMVGTSAQGTTASESTTFIRPEAGDSRLQPGKYVARVVNFAAVEPYTGEISFEGPEEFIPARTETWKLTCLFGDESRLTQDILIARGESQTLDLSGCGTRSADPGTGQVDNCRGADATLVGSRKTDSIIGTNKRDVIVGLGGNDTIRGRGGNDKICGRGGKDRIASGGGKDMIKTGGGNDRASGGGGNDLVSGGGGNDRLSGGGGKDKLRGGKGKDTCKVGREDVADGCER